MSLNCNICQTLLASHNDWTSALSCKNNSCKKHLVPVYAYNSIFTAFQKLQDKCRNYINVGGMSKFKGSDSYPNDVVEEFYFYLLLKKFNRQTKPALPNFYATALNFFELNDFLIRYFANEANPQHQKPIFILTASKYQGHKFLLVIQTTLSEGKFLKQILLISTTGTLPYATELLSELNFLTDTHIYVYEGSDIQSDYNCAWFALEMCFTLSKLPNFFKYFDGKPYKNPSFDQLQQLPIHDDKSRALKENVKNLRLLSESCLPMELSGIFRSVQSRHTLEQLSDAQRSYCISSKGLSLYDSLNRRHQIAFSAIHGGTAPSWPNISEEGEKRWNYAIHYFKDRQIRKMEAALSNIFYRNFVRSHWEHRTNILELITS